MPTNETDTPAHGSATRRLKIAMVAPPWYEVPPRGYGGLEQVCADLVNALVDRGHEVTLFGAGEAGRTSAHFVSVTAHPHYHRLGEVLPDVLHRARVQRHLLGGDFDIVHDHTIPGPLTAGQLAIPTVVTVHGPVDGELGDYYEAIGDSVRLVAISHNQRASRPNLPWLGTVHHGMSLADDATGRAEVQAGPGPDAPIVWLARFSPDKGPDLAIEACRTAGLPLVLAGKCHEAAEERYLNSVIVPMLGDDVTLMVNAGRSDVARLLRSARCLILPIRWPEPFGLVMTDALALGVPVVALRQGSVPEIVEDGVSGFVCDRPEELPGALARIGQLDRAACVRRVREHFSAELMAQRYEQAYLAATAEQFDTPLSARSPTATTPIVPTLATRPAPPAPPGRATNGLRAPITGTLPPGVVQLPPR